MVCNWEDLSLCLGHRNSWFNSNNWYVQSVLLNQTKDTFRIWYERYKQVYVIDNEGKLFNLGFFAFSENARDIYVFCKCYYVNHKY